MSNTSDERKQFGAAKIFGLFLAALFPVLMVFIFKPDYQQVGKMVKPLDKYFPTVVESKDLDGTSKLDTIYHKIPQFKYTNQYNKTITNQDIEGKLAVVDFFFSTCGAACPDMAVQMQRLHKAFVNNTNVKLVSFSLDPKFDQVSILKDYADQHNIVPGKWELLTGVSADSTVAMANNGFKVSCSVDSTGGIDHSDRFVLVDNEGTIRGYYLGTDSAEVEQLVFDIAKLLDAEDMY